MTKKSVTVDRPCRSRMTTSSAFLDKARLAASLASFSDVKEVFSLIVTSPLCQVAEIDISRPSATNQIHHMIRADIFTCDQQSDPPHSLNTTEMNVGRLHRALAVSRLQSTKSAFLPQREHFFSRMPVILTE
jgi:hypothetical protein